MKFFRNVLVVIALLSMDPIISRMASSTTPIAKQTVPTPTKMPIQPPITQQPDLQPKTYVQALNAIKAMPSHTVITNNVLKPEFINFVKSLNLSSLETKALLEAGANLHTIWTDNNEANKKILLSLRSSISALSQNKPTEQKKPTVQKPAEQKKETPQHKQPTVQPVQQQSPLQAHFATNSLIMLLDPEKVEQIGNYSRAMVQDAIIDLYEQAAPIIMTSNILEIITSIRQRIGENNFQQLKAKPYNQIMPFAEQLVKTYNIHEAGLHLILLSLINFDSKNFNCYFHKSANLVLIIPQQYITKNIPNANNLNADDRVRVCGFNPTVLTKIDNLTTDNLMQQLKIQQSKPMGQEKIITDLTSLFIPQKRNGELISPEQDTKWVVYLSGHGGPAYQAMGNMRRPLPQIARVAGLTTNNFYQLMKFFDNNIDTAFLHYTTCFAGGYNQTFVNQVLSSLDVNFIVSSEGLGERKTSGLSLQMRFSSQEPRISLAQYPFTDFFRLLRLFVSKPEQFVKIKEAKKDPVVAILDTIHSNMTEENQPFVRFPGAGVFGALSMGKKTKVLTQTIVKAHEIENKTIDASTMNVIIVNPSRINVPLNLGQITKSEHRAIVSPTPTSMTQYHEAIHIFKEIICKSSIQSLLFNFVYLNTSMNTQTFVVKTVTGVSITPHKTGIIHNFIVQINKQSMQLGKMSANVQVAFELNGNIYQSTTAIQSFDNTNALYNIFEQITLVSQPEKTTDMNTVANKFLSPQEITKLAKPITLSSIVEFINAKIDTQAPSTFKQPDADNTALRKLLERKQK